MPLSPTQIELVREGFAELTRHPERRSLEFYEAFFARAPNLKPMFREDLEGQGMRFLSTLSVIVAHLDRPQEMADRLADLGTSHRALGVKPADFEPMGEALVETIERALGEAFTPEMREAWEAAFTEISKVIIEKGGIAKQ